MVTPQAPVLPEVTALRNKPLAEVIFELRWKLQAGQAGMPSDPGFRVLFGRFYDKVISNYPILKDLPVAQMPEEMAPHVVRHQFWSGDSKWPVTQIGPGILTVNDTKEYSWETFKPRIRSASEALFASYPTEIAKLTPLGVELKYLNAIPFDRADRGGLIEFLRDSLHTRVEVDRRLFDKPDLAGTPLDLHLNLTYPVDSPDGIGNLLLATGMKEGQPSLILQLLVRSTAEKAPQTTEAIDAWLDAGHRVIKRWFVVFCEGQLLKTFS